ncbi:MAG: GtrA family protein [Bacteroides sp.]|nr:GtrA family protein [Bacteroidales bacterium]MBD5283481.1 GtrA family protein [Bacteroides sp.]MBD5336599.1 GtrA family protein [Bacteroides sp.]
MEDSNHDSPRSVGAVKALGRKALKSDSLFFTFLRSTLSSQAASWLDMALSFVLFSFAGLSPWLSTALGALFGGVVNCVINYKFTFHADGCPWKAVIVKYFMIWIGSLLLNAFGTQILYHIMLEWKFLVELGFRPDGFFAAARLLVSLIVSLGWNFLFQKIFVYRKTAFDPYAIRFVNFILHQRGDEANNTK